MRFKSFIFGLVLVGLVASLYASPKTLFLKISFRGSTGPYNTQWNGTSDLASMLREQGYSVVSPLTQRDLEDAVKASGRYKRIIYVLISPDTPLDPEARDSWIPSALRNLEGFSVLIADENTTSNKLLGRYGLVIRGETLFYGEDNPFPPAVFRLPGTCVETVYEGRPAYMPANYTEHILRLDWASYIAVLRPQACIVGVTIAKTERSPSTSSHIVGVYLDHRLSRDMAPGNMLLVISDGSLFINSALRQGGGEYRDFALGVFKLLSGGSPPDETLIIMDSSHYRRERILDENGYPETSIPLPLVFHPAMLTVVALSLWRTAEAWFYNYLSSQPLIGLPVALVASILVYGYLRKQAGMRVADDTVIRRVEELEILAETPVRAQYASIRRLGKKEALRIASDLYELLDAVLQRNLGIGIAEALSDPVKTRYLAETVGMREDEILGVLTRLSALREKAEKKKITPVVLRWTRTTRLLVEDVEKVLEGLGYTLLNRSEERYKGLEYGVRGLF